MLEAAHIEPYVGPQGNRIINGLLLRADLHTLFDLNLIGVDQDGRLVVSSQLKDSSYAALHGTLLKLPERADQRPSKRALAAHLKRLV